MDPSERRAGSEGSMRWAQQPREFPPQRGWRRRRVRL